jgi:hypothetical protein
MGIDLPDLMNALQQASDLDLMRLCSAIDHLLHSPSRILAVRQHLQLGQEVDFWTLRGLRTSWLIVGISSEPEPAAKGRPGIPNRGSKAPQNLSPVQNNAESTNLSAWAAMVKSGAPRRALGVHPLSGGGAVQQASKINR